MDAKHFDRLARALGASGSRRSALAALLTGLVTSLLPAAALVADGRKGKAKGGPSKQGDGRGKGRGQDRNRKQGKMPPDLAAADSGDVSPAADAVAVESLAGPESAQDGGGPESFAVQGGNTRRRGKGKRRGKNNGKGRGKQRNHQRAQAEAVCYKGTNCTPGPGKNLAGCDFSHSATLKGRNLTGANLGKSNLFAADAGGANLSGANLGGACLVDANLRGANLRATNQGGAIFCRTTMTNGSLNTAGCAKGTTCCPTCDSAHPCAAGQACCAGRCVPGDCCTDGQCSDPAKPICVANSCAPCTNHGQCGTGKRCCDGRCQSGNCCQAADCGASGDTCDGFTCRCGSAARCAGATPLCCGQGAEATCRECCASGQCPCPGCAQNETRCSAQGQCVQCEDASTCLPPPRPDCQEATCDAQGQCGIRDKAEGTACDDGNACTLGDTCQSGHCTPGPAKACADDTCKRGVCNPANGDCGYEPVADDTACEDGNLCTTGDACRNGECRPGEARVCPDAPCKTGVCDPATGECRLDNVTDGTSCDDGNPCTVGDACRGGFCRPGPARTCSPTGNPCTETVCNPDSGNCEVDNLPPGTSCDDGNACTLNTACQNGVCTPEATRICPGAACQRGVCDSTSGACRLEDEPDGTVCPRGTESGICLGGACVECREARDCPAPPSCHRAVCTPQHTCDLMTLTGTFSDAACPSECCEGVCCADGDLCAPTGFDSEGVPLALACCAPEPRAVTCAGGKCGVVLNNCFSQVPCECGQSECALLQCDTAAGVCRAVDTSPDGTSCFAANGDDGVCCGGQCLAGVCCADADCAPSGNDCVGNQCQCGAGNACQAPTRGCCGTSPVCINIDTDRTNCGACGAICPLDVTCRFPTCVGGTCVQQVIDDGIGPGCNTFGSRCCDGNCKNLQNDPANCGTCDRTCPAGTCQRPICASGTCQPAVAVADGAQTPGCNGPTEICCSGTCKNIHADFQNCAACGRVCPPTTDRCVNGVCRCGGGPACTGGLVCNPDSGTCVCPVGTVACNGTCQPGNCCPASGPAQTCAQGRTCCSTGCKSLETDPGNCGQCGRACGQGESCQGGICGQVCGAGFCRADRADSKCCEEICTDTQTDEDNCGVCGVECGVGKSCVAGACVCGCRNTACFVLAWGPEIAAGQNLSSPSGLAAAPDGTIYVVDSRNNLIHRFSALGEHILGWGGSGTGEGEFDAPFRVAVAADGTVYVSDRGENRRIQVFGPTGTYLREWTYNAGGLFGFSPRGLAVSPSGLVYVADFANEFVHVFDSVGAHQRDLGGPGTGNAQFDAPEGVAVSATGIVYVADSGNDRIQVFTPTGAYFFQWGSPGSGNGQFNNPSGVAVGSDGRVFVADTGNRRVQVFSANGVYQGQWEGVSGNDGPFFNANDVTAAPDGTVYVVDLVEDRILAYCVTPPPP